MEEKPISSENLYKAYLSSYNKKHFRTYNDYWSKKLINLSTPNRAFRVLDCGCGIGLFLEHLCNSYGEVYGLDPSGEAIANCVCKNRKIKELRINNAENLKFEDSFFDIVFCRTSIHHFKNVEEGLSQISRVLKKGGHLILSEPCRDNLLWRKIGQFYTSYCKRFNHVHHIFTSKKLHKLLTDFDFKIKSMSQFGYIVFLVAVIPYSSAIANLLSQSEEFGHMLARLDKNLAKTPVINKLNWHVIIKAEKF